MSVRDTDKCEIGSIAKKFEDLGFTVYATDNTADVIRKHGVKVIEVGHLDDSGITPKELIRDGKINYIISTSAHGRDPKRSSVRLRRLAVEHAIPCLTSLDTANAVADSIASRWNVDCTELVDINNLRDGKIRLDFVKMHTCGNDYIYFDCMDKKIGNPEGLSITFADRHNGIGGDGTIIIRKSEIVDAGMRMFNRDGSEAKICANGIGCVAKYLYENGIVGKKEMTIETLSGIKTLSLTVCDGKVAKAKVDVGKIDFTSVNVPVALCAESAIGVETEVAGGRYKITCASVGNPHCVVFANDMPENDIFAVDLPALGSAFEIDPIFPERTNVEFVHVIDDHTIIARIWERGSGETNACGTGACAAAAAAIENGYCKPGDITVHLKGGILVVSYENGILHMTGETHEIYRGQVEI